MTTCRGICLKLKIARSYRTSPYAIGLKHCTHCNVFFKWTGIMCPCCSTRLRGTPRTKTQKENLRNFVSRKNIKKKVLKSFFSAAALSAITGICIYHGIQHMLHSIPNLL